MAQTYQAPTDIDAPAWRSSAVSDALTPDKLVTVMFRGGPQIHDMYDGIDQYVPPNDALPEGYQPGQLLKPCYGTLPYAIAAHLQKRNFVPGTRSPLPEHSRNGAVKAISQLAIVGLDPEARCQPLDAEMLARWGKDIEAIDRDEFVTISQRNARPMDTKQALANARAAGRDVREGRLSEVNEAAVAPAGDAKGLMQAEEAAFVAAGGEAPKRGRR